MAAAPCTLNMASVLLLLLLFSIHWPDGSYAFSLMNYLCNNGSSYALNSTYRSNVVALLGSLSANASSSVVGFATGTLGHAPDQTWGLVLCRGDVNGSGCASCLALAPDIAFGDCRGVKDVSIYYDRCLLRYSDTDFLASPGDAAEPVQYGTNLEVNVTADPDRFVGLAADLVAALSSWAARNSTARYAAGVVTSAKGFTTTDSNLVHNIYGLVQCTPNLAPEACLACLGRLKDEMPAVFNGSTGGQFNAVWCNLRFEVFLFYDSSPVVKLVAPSLTPAPSGAAVHDDAKSTRGTGYAATVVAIVLGVLVVLLLSTFMIYLWRKAQVKRYAEEADDSGSLLFDLATLRRATANFGEENKLGHGGFGAVYKGFLPDGRQIAVKRLDKASGQGLKELRNELLLVAKLRHNNLAKLLGVCLKGQEKLLVYEYINRSLDTFLFVLLQCYRLLGALQARGANAWYATVSVPAALPLSAADSLIRNTTLSSPIRSRAASMSPVTALLAGTAVPPAPYPSPAPARKHARHYSVGFLSLPDGGGRAALAVECSSRPQKKGTKHHMKTRPKKTQPWDIKRRPTQYPPLPPLPPDWTLVASGATVDVEEATAVTPVLEVAAAVAAPAAAD